MAGKKTGYPMAFIITAFIGLLFAGGAWALSDRVPARTVPDAQLSDASRSRILSVLETRTRDEKVIGKAAEKLRNLNGRELRLMASLCDRIEESNGSAGADIAFSLMTVLIVLS